MASRAEAIPGRLGQQDSESVALLERLVNQDSGTCDRAAVNRVGDMPAIVNDAGSGLGLSFAGVTTGGGSDGNRTAEIIPTLDGLGAVGSKMHSPDGYLEVSSLRERAALLALFMETWYERF